MGVATRYQLEEVKKKWSNRKIPMYILCAGISFTVSETEMKEEILPLTNTFMTDKERMLSRKQPYMYKDWWLLNELSVQHKRDLK